MLALFWDNILDRKERDDDLLQELEHLASQNQPIVEKTFIPKDKSSKELWSEVYFEPKTIYQDLRQHTAEKINCQKGN